jgi:hypothetical protein
VELRRPTEAERKAHERGRLQNEMDMVVAAVGKGRFGSYGCSDDDVLRARTRHAELKAELDRL